MTSQLPRPQKRSHIPQLSAHVYCGQTAGCIRIPLGTELGLSAGDIVLDGTQLPPKRGTGPNFRPTSVVAKRLAELNATCYGGRPRPRRLCVRWGPSSHPKMGHSPQFSARVYCGQMARRIKMPLGTEVGIGPADIGLDGAKFPQKRGHNPQNFRSVSIMAKRSPISATVELLFVNPEQYF